MSDDVLINHLIKALEDSAKAMDEAHESLFTQCMSNPVKNAWGVPVDMSKINELQNVSRRIKGIARNYRLNKE